MLNGSTISDDLDPTDATVDVDHLWACVSGETLQRTIDSACRVLKVDCAMLSSFKADQQKIICSSDPCEAGATIALPYSLCHHVVAAGTPISADVVADHAALATVAPTPGIEAYLGLPIRLGSGRVMGTLCVSDSVPHGWSGEDLDVLSILAAGIGNEVDLRLELARHDASAASSRRELADVLATVDEIPGLLFERRKIDATHAAYTFFGVRKSMLPAVRELTQHGDAAPLSFVHPDDRDFVRAALMRSTAEETDLDLTFRIRDPGSVQRWLRSQSMVRRADDGRVSWAGHCFDVTDLIAARDDAEADRAGRERALVNVNHEIRTPLQAIVGFTGFLTNETRPDVIAAHAKTIRSASEAVLSIVNQTLDDAGSRGSHVEPVDLRTLAEACLELVAPQAREKGLVVRLVVSDDIPRRAGISRQKTHQALVNLLNNAVKYTDEGAVTLRVDPAADGVRFSVVDTGIGVPMEKRPLLFQRFSRIEADARPGVGLGLSITKDLVESQNGRIGLDNGPGGGTIFWFELPDIALAEGEPGSPANSIPPRDVAPTRDAKPAEEPMLADRPSGARILLADDLDLNRKLIADMLSFEGHHVDCVADGAAAVQAASERRYDLILMDMIMPVMDGTAATRAIRALPEPACRVPIVALTAHSFREQLDACLAAGMDGTLIKPLSIAALTGAVESWTRGRIKAA